MAILEINNIKKSFAKTEVLKGISFTLEKGEVLAIIGSSGSGKTTLLRCMNFLETCDTGTISIDGKPMEMLNLSDYRHFISVVPQNSILFTGTIKDNITYGMPNVSKKRLEDAIEMANINEFVKDMPKGLNTMIGEHGGKLSGGQKQRISIARALIQNPKIIIFDDSTSAVDSLTEKNIRLGMKETHRDCTKLIIAQRISSIRHADKILILSGGKIVFFIFSGLP